MDSQESLESESYSAKITCRTRVSPSQCFTPSSRCRRARCRSNAGAKMYLGQSKREWGGQVEWGELRVRWLVARCIDGWIDWSSARSFHQFIGLLLTELSL